MSIWKKTAITAVAVSTFAISTLTADAGRRERNFALGVVGGLVAGAAIAGAANRGYSDDDYYYDERPVYTSRRSYRSAHVSWCLDRYNSYDPGSDTWVTYRGIVRTCRSPYSR